MTPREAEQEAAQAKEGELDRETKENLSKATSEMDDIKMDLLMQASTSRVVTGHGLPGGFTLAAPRFREDLEVILFLAKSKQPYMHCVRGRKTVTAYYGFGDASGAGFGASVERPGGLHG